MGQTVLLLEDDPAIRELLEMAIVDDGHDVVIRAGLEDVRALGIASPDSLALVDFWGTSHHVLSDGERDEVVRLADAVPTILVTGRQWAQSHPVDELGLLTIIRKPFDVGEVCITVSAWIALLKADSAEVRNHSRRLRMEADAARASMRAAGDKMTRLMGTSTDGE